MQRTSIPVVPPQFTAIWQPHSDTGISSRCNGRVPSLPTHSFSKPLRKVFSASCSTALHHPAALLGAALRLLGFFYAFEWLGISYHQAPMLSTFFCFKKRFRHIRLHAQIPACCTQFARTTLPQFASASRGRICLLNKQPWRPTACQTNCWDILKGMLTRFACTFQK